MTDKELLTMASQILETEWEIDYPAYNYLTIWLDNYMLNS